MSLFLSLALKYMGGEKKKKKGEKNSGYVILLKAKTEPKALATLTQTDWLMSVKPFHQEQV